MLFAVSCYYVIVGTVWLFVVVCLSCAACCKLFNVYCVLLLGAEFCLMCVECDMMSVACNCYIRVLCDV